MEVEVVIVVEGEVVAVVDVHHTTHYSTRIGRCLINRFQMPRVLLPQIIGQIFRQREQMVLDFYVNILSFGLYSVSKH